MQRGRTLLLVGAMLVVNLAGCLDGDELDRSFERVQAQIVDTERSGAEFWMVWVRGSETDERRNQPVCSRLPVGFELLRSNETLRYDPERYEVDRDEVEVVLAIRHEDVSSSCPEAITLVGDPAQPHTAEMGQYGGLALEVREDGRLLANGHELALGEAGSFTYEGEPADSEVVRVDGQFRVVNLGAWDREDLWARAP